MPRSIEITGDTISTDSVRKLVPKGFYILTELGAKNALKANVDAKAYHEKWQFADRALGDMSLKLALTTAERNRAIALNISKDTSLNTLTTQLKWSNALKWTGIVVSCALGVRLLTN